jgi:hypothetical protein
VWVRCEDCGRQRLPLDAVTLQECESPVSFTVTWRCSRCRRSVVTNVAVDDVERLAQAGVRRVVWRRPTELGTTRPVGELLTNDDLLDWHQKLSTPGWLEAEVGKLTH